MQLESLKIDRREWGENKGQLEGEIIYKAPSGKIQLLLNDRICAKLLYIVAEEMVESTKELANHMTVDIINAAAPMLANKSDTSE